MTRIILDKYTALAAERVPDAMRDLAIRWGMDRVDQRNFGAGAKQARLGALIGRVVYGMRRRPDARHHSLLIAARSADKIKGAQMACRIAIVRRCWDPKSPRRSLHALWATTSGAPLDRLREIAVLLDHAAGRRGVPAVRAQVERLRRFLDPDRREAMRANRRDPYVVLERGAPTRRQYPYRHCAVLELDGSGIQPEMISDAARGVRRIVWQSGRYPANGGTSRSQRRHALDQANALAAHLNRLHAARHLGQPIRIDEIMTAVNEEFRRELIEAYGGLAAYVRDVGAAVVQQDNAGALLRIDTPAGEPIVAVAVTCPSTGREYLLRVPPATTTAREGVAWTFGVGASDYRPTIQS